MTPGDKLDASEQPDVALDMRADDAAQLLSAHDPPPLPLSVDAARNRFPFCIVWSPIPVLTWLLPFVGHLGIATSDGCVLAWLK